MRELLEQVGLMLSQLHFHHAYGLIEGCADVRFSGKELNVELLSEHDSCLIQYKSVSFDADNVFGPVFVEDFANVSGIASGNENDIELGLLFRHELADLLRAEELTVTRSGLEEQEVADVLVLAVVPAHRCRGVPDTMTRYVKHAEAN